MRMTVGYVGVVLLSACYFLSNSNQKLDESRTSISNFRQQGKVSLFYVASTYINKIVFILPSRASTRHGKTAYKQCYSTTRLNVRSLSSMLHVLFTSTRITNMRYIQNSTIYGGVQVHANLD